MNIHLPMKNDLLDKGEGTIWTGGGLNLPKITNFGRVRCAKFDGQERLRLQDATLIGSLKEWTIQVWIYSTKIATNRSYIFSDYSLGNSINATYAFISIDSNTQIYFLDTAYSVALLNKWHHIKLTSDGARMYLYVDGSRIANIMSSKTGFYSWFTIGDERGDYGQITRFHGYMTQFKFSDVYNDKDLPLNDGKFIYINKNNEVWAMV